MGKLTSADPEQLVAPEPHRDSKKRRNFFPIFLPPSAFREVGQLTVCGCQDCTLLSSALLFFLCFSACPAPIGAPSVTDPAFQRDVTARYKDKALAVASAVCWISECGKRGRERGEPLNLCGAELEKLLLRETQTPYVTLLICSFYFSWRKKKGLKTN